MESRVQKLDSEIYRNRDAKKKKSKIHGILNTRGLAAGACDFKFDTRNLDPDPYLHGNEEATRIM